MNNNDLPKNWLNLEAKVCVLTGAAGGIGAAIAAALVSQNAHVVLLDRDERKCRELAVELAKNSEADVSVLHCDIADPFSVQQAAEQVQALHGRCDVLINNASVLQAGALETLTLDEWNQVLSVNLTGYLLCAQGVRAPDAGPTKRQHRAYRVDRRALPANLQRCLQYSQGRGSPCFLGR